MSTNRGSVAGRAAVIGGFHAWPVLRACFEDLVPVPDSLEHYAGALGYVDREYGPAVLAPVQFAMDGHLDEFSAIFVDRDHATAFSYLQELHRRGVLPGLPPMHIADFIVDDASSTKTWTRAEVDRLVAFCRRTIGHEPDVSRIEAELAAEHRLHAALATIQDRRLEGRLGGVASKNALASRRDALPDEIVAALAQVADAPASGARVLLVPAGSSKSAEIQEFVASAGGEVIAEDDWHGSRSIRRTAPADSSDVLDRVLDELLASPATDRIGPMARRLGWVESTLKETKVDAVVVVTDPSDARHGWDVPHVLDIARAQGVAGIRVHADLPDAEAREQAREQLRSDLAATAEKE